jgi:pyruvate,water dikinase
MPKKWVFWFEELGQEHNDLVGKKCANLGEMTRLGLRDKGIPG